ncbi:hypothetical protein NL676_034649 [Syzygium grande]|nr:hypothetical protein NL676_034649 [Syzygium grande]
MSPSLAEVASILAIVAALLGTVNSVLGILHAVARRSSGSPPPRAPDPGPPLLLSSYCYFDITEIDSVNTNEFYNAVQLYLSSFVSTSGSHLSLTRAVSSSATTFGLSNNDCINGVFDRVAVQWVHVVTQRQSQNFAAGQAFYQRTGWAWKRGYLLYGPLGTGKSSMIAAMANFLGHDIYDLELTQVHSNSELLNLLVTTSSKSIIVIKDIDCLINLSNRSKVPQAAAPQSYNYPGAPDAMCGGEDGNNSTITFSELLNFPNGLWSCFGGERIFVFTTNHIEKLDPALLQSSRMDMHICMS